MKRSLLDTLWIGAVAAALAIALQISGLLSRPALVLAQALGLAPNDPIGFGNFLLVLALSFGVAWAILQVMETARRVRLVALLLVELIGAAWILHAAGFSFPPLPAILATIFATALAVGVTATHSDRQRQASGRLFGGRVAQSVVDRLTENKALNLSEPAVRTASFVFCEIANEADLINDLPPAVSAQLTREFIACASRRFLQEGGYLLGADGEGVRVLFGFPEASERHATDAARAVLSFRENFRVAAAAKPDSLGKIDLRIGISSGPVVVSVRGDAPGGEVLVAGEPLELARRLARVNQIYGSQILLDPGTLSAAGKEIVARPLDFLRSAQAHERLEVYELLALADKANPEEMARRDRFWTGVVYFRERRWNDALTEFNRARSENGERDEPLQWYLRRLEPLCLRMATEPTPVAEPFAPL